MSPSDGDATALEGFQKCLHLPQFLTCGICGSICDQQSAKRHAEWHEWRNV